MMTGSVSLVRRAKKANGVSSDIAKDPREFAEGRRVPGTNYRVIRRLGSGGMGVVYEVEHEELGKRFVLKALLGKFARRNDLIQRLRNEWRALGRLEHSNIVSVTDAGMTARRVPFFVMERLQGETLGERLKRDRTIAPNEAIAIVAQVLDGLSAAHRIGIVHRDVKPPNIFLLRDGGVKVLDFGVAKMLDAKACCITGRGVMLGTPKYMAPEQAGGGAVDGRTDIYSVGLVLFAMIAGVSPFEDARDANELFLAHLMRPAPPLRRFAPSCPAAIDELAAKMLAKTPAERPASADIVAQALRDVTARMTMTPPTPLLGSPPASGLSVLSVCALATTEVAPSEPVTRTAATTLVRGREGAAGTGPSLRLRRALGSRRFIATMTALAVVVAAAWAVGRHGRINRPSHFTDEGSCRMNPAPNATRFARER